MIKQAISYLSIMLLLTLVFSVYGSALYFWFDENRSVDVSLIEPSANIKPSVNINPSAGLIKKNFAVTLTTETSEGLTKKPSAVTLIKPSTRLITKTTTQLVLQPLESVEQPLVETESFFQDDLAFQAELRLQSEVTYDGRYLRIGYPLGDVPAHIGVCTDVVIRSFRGLDIDLQQRVHEDMKRNFRSYPNNWQLTKPDSNIDHRRVPNLMTCFKRTGASLKISDNPYDYKIGSIVAWDLGNGLTHIGIVSNYVSELTGNPLIVHNIGAGPEMNDM